MKAERCSMAPLVEARRDGRLSERELASLERHLATCPGCAELAADLSRIAELVLTSLPSAPPLEHRRGRVRLLREAALGPERPRAARARPVLLLVSAAALLSLLILAVTNPSDRLPPVAQAPPPAQPSLPRTVTTVQPDDGARFSRSTSAELEAVTLEEGGITFSIRPLAHQERFVVKTADAEVEVRGTVFRVEALAKRIQLVRVIEGKVEVRFRGTTTVVALGQEWHPSLEALPPLPVDEPASSVLAPTPRAPVSVVVPRRAPRAGEQRTDPPALDGGAAPATEDASKSFAEGVRMIERGDYGAAADQLEGFAAAHPKDESAEDAAFLAIVSLQRAGRRASAAAAARRYLVRYPRGYRRAEAEVIAGSSGDGGASSP